MHTHASYLFVICGIYALILKWTISYYWLFRSKAHELFGSIQRHENKNREQRYVYRLGNEFYWKIYKCVCASVRVDMLCVYWRHAIEYFHKLKWNIQPLVLAEISFLTSYVGTSASIPNSSQKLLLLKSAISKVTIHPLRQGMFKYLKHQVTLFWIIFH